MEDEFITNLRCVDDILLIARSLSQIQTMLADLALETATVCFKIHPDKPKIQHNNIGYGLGAKEAKCSRITVEILSKEETAAYLGRVKNLGNLHDFELHNKITKTWTKLCIFRTGLTDLTIPIHFRT